MLLTGGSVSGIEVDWMAPQAFRKGMVDEVLMMKLNIGSCCEGMNWTLRKAHDLYGIVDEMSGE